MKRAMKSFGFAIAGLAHAIREERNIRLFGLMQIPIITVGVMHLQLPPFAWIVIAFCGGVFLITELLNTALERLADTIDDGEKKRRGGHYHPGIKQAKDIGAAASLIALLLYVAIVLLIFSLFLPQ